MSFAVIGASRSWLRSPQCLLYRARQGIIIVLIAILSSCVSWFEPEDKSVAPPSNIKTIRSGFPGQKSGALRADQMLAKFQSLPVDQREQELMAQLKLGAVPKSMRYLVPVSVDSAFTRSKKLKIVIWVLPDYFSMGTDENTIRMPLTPKAAQKIADLYGLNLPTTKIVDIVYQKAQSRLAPRPIPPSDLMTNFNTFYTHNSMIKTQLSNQIKPWYILAGHKKDVVTTNRLNTQPGRVAIYGWHRSPYDPIQPLSLVHGNDYADYSHGIRFVWNNVSVNGRLLPMTRFLRDPVLAPILSSEGIVRRPRVD